MAALPGETPAAQQQVYLFYTNDAGTLLFPVAPSTPLPVTGTVVVTPSGTQTVIPVKSTTMTTAQVTVPATTNGILILAANANRLGAIIANTSGVTVWYSSAATGLTTANGAEMPSPSALNIDGPLYTGAIYGIVATGTALVTATEFTA